MKLSLEWLRDYVPLPEDIDPKKLAHELTMATVEVEQVIDLGAALDKVVVGLIEKVEPHPDSDRLNLVTVELGDRQQRVVCGASNVAAGMLIAFANSGAVVRGRDGEPFTLGKAVIRGVESEGMICAGQELGLQELLPCSGKAIADLTPFGFTPGQSLASALGYDDVVLEIDNKSLTNRPDLWGHYGVARELAALYDLPLAALPEFDAPGEDGGVSITIDDASRCMRYTGTLVSGVDAREAPLWMRSRLSRVGQRPINLVVDLTNYVMMAVGQPSHAFDARDIVEGIQVRTAREEESLVLLDGAELSLSSDDLVIASGSAVALAGVMGGEMAVREDTTELLFEVASFEPVNIRRTARTYGLRTESSSRFEKGLDTPRVDVALGLFFDLLKQTCPGAAATAFVDSHPAPTPAVQVDVPVAFIQRRLGGDLSADEMQGLLSRLGFEATRADGVLQIAVPSWRGTGDVSIPEDIVEEVGRLYGYENLSFRPPVVELEAAVIQPRRRLERRIKEHLAHVAGLQEVVTYPWAQEKLLAAAGLDGLPCLELANPQSPDTRRVRPALVPQLLEVVISNLRWQDAFGVFELGRVFADADYKETPGTSEKLPYQPRHLSGALVGPDAVALFRELKGVLEDFSRGVQCAALTFCRDEETPWADPAGRICICAGDVRIGSMGVLSARTKRLAGIRNAEVAIFELDVDALEPHVSRENTYAKLPRYPEVDFDISAVFEKSVSWASVKASAAAAASLVREVQFVDEFVGSQLPEGHKSLTLRLRLGSDDATLVREQIDAAAQDVITALKAEFGAEIRG